MEARLVVVFRPMHESVCDEIAPDSPISISSKLCNSQTSEDRDGDPGQFDELLLDSSRALPVKVQKI